MILAIEILFLIAGIYALITAKLPSWFVGKGFIAEGNKVRLLGILMAATLPIVFCGGFAIGIVGGIADFKSTAIATMATIFEIGFVVVVAVIVAVVVRKIRVPEVPSIINPPGQPPLS